MRPLVVCTSHSHIFACILPFCVWVGISFSVEIRLLQPNKCNKNLNSAGFQEMRKSVCGWGKNIKEEALLV